MKTRNIVMSILAASFLMLGVSVNAGQIVVCDGGLYGSCADGQFYHDSVPGTSAQMSVWVDSAGDWAAAYASRGSVYLIAEVYSSGTDSDSSSAPPPGTVELETYADYDSYAQSAILWW